MKVIVVNFSESRTIRKPKDTETCIRYLFTLFVLLASLRLSLGIPVPQGGGSGTAPNTISSPPQQAAAPTTPASGPTTGVTPPKKNILSHGVFNSWLCGAGYLYDRGAKMCIAQTPLSKDISGSHLDGSGALANTGPGPGTNINSPTGTAGGTQTNSLVQTGSRETEEYVDPAEENVSLFFPLECGMNYRYLRGAKICKPKSAPASSESDEKNIGKLSSEE